MRKPVVTKSIILVNGTDTPGGVEYGSDLVLHPRWKLNLMFVSTVSTSVPCHQRSGRISVNLCFLATYTLQQHGSFMLQLRECESNLDVCSAPDAAPLPVPAEKLPLPAGALRC